jgi:hypothetical protein
MNDELISAIAEEDPTMNVQALTANNEKVTEDTQVTKDAHLGNFVDPLTDLPPHVTGMLRAWLPESVEGMTSALEDIALAARGDTFPTEKILAMQGLTLDVLYHSLLRKAESKGQGHHAPLKDLISLALTAQKASRETLLCLERIRNPTSNTFISATGPTQVLISEARRDVFRVLEAQSGQVTPTDLARALNVPLGTAKKRLWDMAKDGTLKQEVRGKYILPATGGTSNAA